MGDYADMCLEGEACAGCGELFLDDEAQGFPRYCDRCEPDDVRPKPGQRTKSVPCPRCTRRFHTDFALSQHRAVKGH